MNTVPDNYKALVVDDDVMVRRTIVRSLEREQISTEEADDGLQAESMLLYNAYDLLVTDLRMPQRHGHKLVLNVLEIEKRPLIVVVTGLVNIRVARDLFRRGVDDILYKPIDYELFGAKMQARLKRRETTDIHGGSNIAEALSSEIDKATSSLRTHLEKVQESFQDTIENLNKQKEHLEAGFLGSVRVLTNLLNQVTAMEGSHAVRVADFAVKIGKVLHLDNNRLRNLEAASLLHEIGQFGMPDSIRMKPFWELTQEERGIFKKYPLIGATLLEEIKGADDIVRFVEFHAENYDGSGFPEGRRAGSIPLEARVIRIADGFDSFRLQTAERRSYAEARDHLMTNKATLYDPKLVSKAIELAEEIERAELSKQIIRVDTLDLEEGMVLAEDLLDKQGRLLARTGVEVTKGMHSRLRRLVSRHEVNVYKPEPAVDAETHG